MNLKSHGNPLNLAAAAAAIAAAAGICQAFRDFNASLPLIVRTLAFLLFLGLYLVKSRFAWHAIVLIVLLVTPFYVLLPIIQQKSIRSKTIWVAVVLTLMCLIYLWRIRRPYFRFLQSQLQLGGVNGVVSKGRAD
jgi:RsiW-degrading membrane proteinase PrsW (M82 family)